jgi:PDZ domain-containing secreted protein
MGITEADTPKNFEIEIVSHESKNYGGNVFGLKFSEKIYTYLLLDTEHVVSIMGAKALSLKLTEIECT